MKSPSSATGGKPVRFDTTHWSVVLVAARTHSPEAERALETLCLVPGTHLVLVYEVRDRVRQAQFTSAVLFLPCAAALALWLVRQGRSAHAERDRR